MLNPEFWLDEEVATVSAHARLLYMGLWGICDDRHATLPDRPEWIKIQIFPYEEVNVRDLLLELERIGKIVKFMHEGKVYWWLKNFLKHQTIDRPSKSKYPVYPSNMGVLDEGSTRARPEVKRSEVNYTRLPKAKRVLLTANKDNMPIRGYDENNPHDDTPAIDADTLEILNTKKRKPRDITADVISGYFFKRASEATGRKLLNQGYGYVKKFTATASGEDLKAVIDEFFDKEPSDPTNIYKCLNATAVNKYLANK